MECRNGFSRFIKKAGFEGRMPKVVSCGRRKKAYDDFRTALNKTGPEVSVMLLVDSEGPKDIAASPWSYLKDSIDNWDKPPGATDEQAHLMVQCMESWFLADKAKLGEYFGQGFRDGALPTNPNIEAIPKNDVLAGLKNATRETKTKGEYKKGPHSFEILAEIDPEKVKGDCPHGRRLFTTLDNISTS